MIEPDARIPQSSKYESGIVEKQSWTALRPGHESKCMVLRLDVEPGIQMSSGADTCGDNRVVSPSLWRRRLDGPNELIPIWIAAVLLFFFSGLSSLM